MRFILRDLNILLINANIQWHILFVHTLGIFYRLDKKKYILTT